ncbi:MAG: BCCT family transporter [Proteobacteria bacterium]|nr:BCCT family transporter [Pseudomonadota bacterium]
MKHEVDWPSFSAAVAIITLVSIPLVLFPESGGKVLVELYGFISSKFGFLYLIAGMAALILLLWLALGRYGKIRLAAGDEQPEFGDFSWAAMLFCAGVGAGLMYWAPIEWAYYIEAPPYGLEAGSTAAAEWAATYGIFHWGPTAWAFYCLPTIAIAYPYYVKKVPFLRLSTGCHYFFSGEEETRAERLIDWLFMIGLLGGAGTSLGFSTPMIAACIARITGWEADFGLEFAVVLVSVALFATSVWFGLKKGIKRLSDINMWLALMLLAFVLLVGPTIFLLKTSVNSLGLMMQNFIKMNSWTDAFTDSGFVENWTIFYWAWWIAYGPFVGMFVTRISRGRSIRQVILGMLGYGSLGAAVFYMILGNYGLHLETTGTLAVTSVLANDGGPAAIVAILGQLPFAAAVIAVFAVIALIFSATTYDSASYILASCATRRLRAGEDPDRWHRVFWAMALAVLPLTLMFVGGLKTLQTATLIVSLPLIFVGVLMAVALVRQLRADHG